VESVGAAERPEMGGGSLGSLKLGERTGFKNGFHDSPVTYMPSEYEPTSRFTVNLDPDPMLDSSNIPFAYHTHCHFDRTRC